MSKRIYIGNLALSTTESSVHTLFAGYGTVNSCRLITDQGTGKSRGFCFVEMNTVDEASKAILGLNGQDVNGNSIKVNEANTLASRSGEHTVIHRRAGFGGGKPRRPIRGY